MRAKSAKETTRVISGHSITLQPGGRYLAVRVPTQHRRAYCPVSIIQRHFDGWEFGASVFVVGSMPIDEADRLIAVFNCVASSIDLGRVWP